MIRVTTSIALRARIVATGGGIIAACLWAPSVFAADIGIGSTCCADLEDRIAELEATVAGTGNRKVSLVVAGYLHSALMVWDDGFEDNVYVTGASNDSIDQTSFQFSGDAQITPDWSAGFHITVRVNTALSGEVSQIDDDAGDEPLTLWEAYWYAAHDQLGQLSVGQASRASDGAPEVDLSGTRAAAFSGAQSIGGGFFLRGSDGALSELSYGDLITHLNGDTANVIRYDTPSFGGFTLSASYGEDDIWDAALGYEAKSPVFEVGASLAYSEISDTGGLGGDEDEIDSSTVVGSIAILHPPSGLNALIAAGHRSFDQTVIDTDGVLRTPSDTFFVYGKLGLIAKWSALGQTAFYGEYGRFEDFATAGTDADIVASLAESGVCSGAGNCRIGGGKTDVLGFGVVQNLDPAAMQVYVGYRRYETDLDLVDRNGLQVPAGDIEDLHTVMIGSIIAF
ncbi:MAG: porin [Pseudomonadota bacterium]